MPFENISIIYNAIKKYGRKSVFFKGFITMTIIVFILVFSVIALCFWYFSGLYDEKSMDNISTELYSVRNRFDSITGQIDSLNVDLLTKNDLLYLVENDKEKLIELLISKKEELGFLYSIYCYIPDEDFIISTSKVYESDSFEEFLDKSWYQLYKQDEKFFYREFPDIGLISKCFSYVKTVGNVVIVYNVDYSKMIPTNSKYESNRLYMISPLHSVIYTSDNKQMDREKLSDYIEMFSDASEGRISYVRMHKTLYEIILLVCSNKNSIKFMMILPRTWNIAIWKIILISVISLVVSLVLSSFFVTRMYKPFRKIIEFEKNIRKDHFDSNNEVNNTLNYVTNISLRQEKIEGKLAQNALLLQNAQVSALQAQLNPHFLFNSLQLLNSMILAESKRDTQTTLIISLLSRLLREAMDMSEFFRPFSKEREISEIYLDIQRIRYPNRFDVVWECDNKVLDLKVPKSILQPLFENAMSYGINRIKEKGLIEIKAFLKNDIFYISVKDNGPGFEPEKIIEINEILSGKKQITTRNIGLYNVNKRIKVLFGQEYGLQILSDGGGKIIIMLPAEPYESKVE